MKIFKPIMFGLFVFSASILSAQSVGISDVIITPNPTSIMELRSTNKGLLIPRVALTQTTSNAPVGAGIPNSLLVYNTATVNDVTPGFYYWENGAWVRMGAGAASASGWELMGNAGTNANIQFLGTTDNQDISIRTFNTEKMRITAGGNVGVGTYLPRAKLHVVGVNTVTDGTDGVFVDIQNTDNTDATMCGIRFKTHGNNLNQYYKAAIFFEREGPFGDGHIHFATGVLGAAATNISKNFTRMTVYKNGYVGIGTTVPEYKLDVVIDGSGGHNQGGRILNTATSISGGTGLYPSGLLVSTDWTINNVYVLDVRSGSPSTSRLFVRADGRVGIGTTTPGYQLHVSTDNAAKPTTNTWTVPSDKNLKTDICPYEAGLTEIMNIQPVWFTYTGEAGMPKDRGVGVIAQDLQKIAPYMISEWDYISEDAVPDENHIRPHTTYLGVNNGAMTYMLVNAVKQQQQIIDNLQSEIFELRQQIEELRQLFLSQ